MATKYIFETWEGKYILFTGDMIYYSRMFSNETIQLPAKYQRGALCVANLA